MLRLTALALLLATLTGCLGLATHQPAPSLFATDSPVQQLTSDTFASTARQPGITSLVLFYTPKSGRSKVLAPVFAKLAASLNGMVVVAAVNCLDQETLCENEGVHHEDTIPVVRAYTGASGDPKTFGHTDATAKQLASFAFFAMPSHAPMLAHSDRPNSHRSRIVLFTDKSEMPNMFKALAYRLHGAIHFNLAKKSDKKFVKLFGVTEFPTLLAEPADGGERVTYSGPMSFPAVLEWAGQFVNNASDSDSVLEVPELADQSCLLQYCVNGRSSLCAVLIASGSSPSLPADAARFRQVEMARRDPVLQHVWLDSDKHGDFIQQAFGLYPTDYPQVIVLSAKKERFATFIGAFDPPSLSDWLIGVTSGKIRTGPLETRDGHLPAMDDGVEGDACQPMLTSTPTNSDIPVMPDHEGERYLRPISAKQFDSEVLESYAAWMILFISNDDVDTVREPWLNIANKTRHAIRMSVVNVLAEPVLATRFNISDTPAVLAIRGSLSGKRTVDSFKRLDGNITESAIHNLSLTLLDSSHVVRVRGEQGLTEFMARQPADASRILLFTKHAGSIPPMYASLSLDYADDLVFGVASHSDTVLMEKFSVKKVPSLTAIGVLPAGSGQLQLIAGNYEHGLALPELHAWCQRVVAEGVVDEGDGMPREVRDQYIASRSKIAEQRKRAKEQAAVKQEL